MASAPQPQLPLFYKDLMPLNSRDHGSWRARVVDKASWIGNQHAIPLTVEEFPHAQRNYPIVFSAGDNSVPLALNNPSPNASGHCMARSVGSKCLDRMNSMAPMHNASSAHTQPACCTQKPADAITKR